MSTTTLRAVTHRLTTTPVEQLPAIASFLATSLTDCAELLSAPQVAKSGKAESDNTVQIHKLKTRLASLLQDRSIEGRWTAVVLVKATVEAGQWEILRGYEPIVRSLIGILAKPDPISTRKMSMITLTRIFHLTYQYPTLVREITTPHLPGFITAALNLVSTLVKSPSGSTRKPKPNTPFMETVLQVCLELVPRHPTIFRPFASQLRSLLTEILGSSSVYYPDSVMDIAEQLFASLHKCAPKDKAGAGWTDDCRSTVLSIHRAADYVFRAVKEQWESVDGSLVFTRQKYSEELTDDGSDALGLPGWNGIHAGADRIITLLRILSNFVAMPSASAVALPLGSILDITSRLTSVTAPSTEGTQSAIQANPQIGRDEREMLWSELPRIHVTCMDLLARVASVLETSTTSVMHNMLEQITWVFRNEKASRNVRVASYELLRDLITLNGPAMTKQNVASLVNVLRACCHDLLPVSNDSNSQSKSQTDSKSKTKNGQGTTNADSFLNPDLQKNRISQASSQSPELENAASALLQAVLLSTPAELLPGSIRTEIDRTIILVSDKDAMLASVLNPLPAIKGRAAGASILPFLVRSHADQMEVEALVRPRMPVLMTAPELDAYAEAEEQEEADEMADDSYEAAPETTDFLKAPVPAPSATKSETADQPSVHKRTYIEESTIQTPSLTASSTQETVQKKARFGESSSSEQAPRVSAFVSHPAQKSSLEKQAQPNSQVSAAPVVPVAEDESDDELPTVNMDSDTESEDDEDVTMEG
ncbi:uncharacterized protein N7483_002314 [Penicillium malachiteum]|uniref:uncharacterized protein n=1 Tax=Penicillium malachiteum TaxID=1324776 RepID=UPI00254846B2|nr:uncharacterized protein N7483_002314 [Penicillium malachiteum]KAJ5737189.1 hypothetical protein N7483_002314 [Penicillium malachiteum]